MSEYQRQLRVEREHLHEEQRQLTGLARREENGDVKDAEAYYDHREYVTELERDFYKLALQLIAGGVNEDPVILAKLALGEIA